MTTNKRVYLIGYRGSGKTTVGQLLADRLGFSFADADELLERRAGRSITEVFANEGEAGFRDRESALLCELAHLDQHVIACGGGVVVRPENRQVLRASGYCVWLTGGPATLASRLEADPTTESRRPALTSLPAPREIERLLREREPLYREVAHCIVATDEQSPTAVVSTILSAWPTLPSNCQ